MSWKNAERQVAKILGGTRRIRINYSESCEDVHHSEFAVEVKYGKQVPRWVGELKETVILNDIFVLYPLASSSFPTARAIKKVRIEFLIKGMAQAGSYSNKLPLLCMKRPGQQGLTGCMYVMDYLRSSFWTSSETIEDKQSAQGT